MCVSVFNDSNCDEKKNNNNNTNKTCKYIVDTRRVVARIPVGRHDDVNRRDDGSFFLCLFIRMCVGTAISVVTVAILLHDGLKTVYNHTYTHTEKRDPLLDAVRIIWSSSLVIEWLFSPCIPYILIIYSSLAVDS